MKTRFFFKAKVMYNSMHFIFGLINSHINKLPDNISKGNGEKHSSSLELECLTQTLDSHELNSSI